MKMGPFRLTCLVFLVVGIPFINFTSSITTPLHLENTTNEKALNGQSVKVKSEKISNTRSHIVKEGMSVSSSIPFSAGTNSTIKKPSTSDEITTDGQVVTINSEKESTTNETTDTPSESRGGLASLKSEIETLVNMSTGGLLFASEDVDGPAVNDYDYNYDYDYDYDNEENTQLADEIPVTDVDGPAVNDYDYDYDFVENTELIASLTQTCSGRCGDEKFLPCSCAPICLVYDNCCENFTVDCPHTLDEGMQDFGAYIGVDLVCGKEEVYMVASCPTNGGTQSSATETTFATTELERKILSAPVTDETTGLTFLNISYYECHNDPGEPGQLLSWGLRVLYPTISPLTLDEVLYSEDAIIPYTPMFDKDKITIHRCYNKANLIMSCEGAVYSEPVPAAVVKSDAEKCQKFTAYVYDDWDATFEIFRNHYCAFCHIGRHFGLTSIDKFRPSYNIPRNMYLLAAPSDADKVYLRLEKGSDIPEQPWSEATCPLSITRQSGGETAAENQEICDNVCGNARYSVKPDGRCKAKLRTMIAMSDNYLGLESLQCATALERISEFLSCSMSHIDREPWKYSEVSESAVSVAVDIRTYRVLYLVEISFDTPSVDTGEEILAVKAEDMTYNIYKAALAVKAYQRYRIENNLCENQERNRVEVSTEFESLVLRNVINSFPKNYNTKYDLKAEMLEYRGAIVDSENVSTLCVSDVVDRVVEAMPQLACMEDKFHESDETKIDELLNSTCVDYLHHKGAKLFKNKAGKDSLSSYNFLMLGVALIILPSLGLRQYSHKA